MENKTSLNISVKSFVTAIAVIFTLMILTYVLTFIVPGGHYARVTDAAGNTVIDTAAGFTFEEGGLPFHKWILSPFLVLGANGNITLISVIIFLLIIGGVFACLGECRLMEYMLNYLANRFASVKYRFMAILMLFFMLMGAFIGSFEEVVPMVPIVVALAVSLGWDKVTGLAMSLLAAACGFASGICNPFTVGIAQRLAGLPMFSGIWLRMLAFVLIYSLLLVFVRSHAKKIEDASKTSVSADFVYSPQLERALKLFGTIIGIGIALVISSCFITVLQDYTLIIIALVFLVGGVAASFTAGMSSSDFFKVFFGGFKSMLPSVLMILMASSIRFIMEEGKIQDTILYLAINAAAGLPKALLILAIYLIVLAANFFVASGSAKAFMIIPLIVPLAGAFGISSQLCILAFAFGDGFSNAFYPTNAALLISLGLADISYVNWVKYSWKFQAANLALTSLLLLFGLAVGY